MNMPRNGNEINITIQSDGTILDEFGPYFTVSAIDIPPHGRLIEADKIGLTNFEIILCQSDENRYKSALIMLLDKIEKTETIIPEDKE